MRTIVVTVPAEAAELAADRLWSAGARAVEERSAGAERVELRTSLATDDDRSLARLGVLPVDWVVGFEDVDEVASEAWRDHARPVTVRPGLVIAPAWTRVEPARGVTVIRIEPGGSFGLGDHPTTRLSAALADELVGEGDRVLDVGCGSGLLSILAAHRGAARVVAVDIAEAAREATLDNAARNGVAEAIDVSTTPVDEISGRFDVVLANILAPVLVSMAPTLRRLTAPGGSLVVSGVLDGGYDHVLDALRPMRSVEARHLDGWSAVSLVHEQS